MPKARPPYSPEFRRFAARWSIWSVLVGILPTSPASLSRRCNRSDNGSRGLTGRRAAGRRKEAVWRQPSATSWPGYGVRTSSCGWSATFSLEQRPGSHARPA